MGKRKAKEAKKFEGQGHDTSIESEELRVKPRESRQKIPGSFAPFVLLVSLFVCGALVYSFFFRPISSQVISADVKTSLRVNLDITSLEFATEGSASGNLSICKGTSNFPGISNAKVQILNLQGKELASLPLQDSYAKTGSTCKYRMELSDVPTFSGSKLRVFVRFPFGDSGTFTVEVGDKVPYRAINIRLTLG